MKLLCVLVLAAAGLPAAADVPLIADIPLITVKGEAEASAKPDYVEVSASIFTVQKTVAKAKADVDARARRVVED